MLVPSWMACLKLFDPRNIWRGVTYMFNCFTSSTSLAGHVDGRLLEVVDTANGAREEDFSPEAVMNAA